MLLGLLADPDLPAEIAWRLADELPDVLSREVSDGVAWEVRVVCDRFMAYEQGDAGLLEAAGRRRTQEGWDLAVCLTDLPQRVGLRPVVADASLTDGVALASLPALGAQRLYQRTLRGDARHGAAADSRRGPSTASAIRSAGTTTRPSPGWRARSPPSVGPSARGWRATPPSGKQPTGTGSGNAGTSGTTDRAPSRPGPRVEASWPSARRDQLVQQRFGRPG